MQTFYHYIKSIPYFNAYFRKTSRTISNPAPVLRTVRGFVEYDLEHYRDRSTIAPSPLISSMMDDCIEKGADKTDAGVRYILYSVMVTGLSNFVDSLCAIKKVVFDDKIMTLEEIAQLCKTNFKDNEALRQKIINRVPKVGNDVEEIDALMVKCMKDCAAIVDKMKSEYDTDCFVMGCGVGTFEHGPRFGRNVGASADGRAYRAPISSNYSPSLGLNRNGLTAAYQSYD